MQHVIKNQVFDLRIRNKQDAYRLQQLVSEQFYGKIVSVLEQAFDKAFSKSDLICIDKIEIDLGTITEKEMENGDWIDLIYKTVSEQLHLLKYNDQPKTKLIKMPLFRGVPQQWMFYMQYGHLPWNVAAVNERWYISVLQVLATDHASISELRKLVLSNPVVTQRIILQHEEKFRVALIETLIASPQKVLPIIIRETAAIISSLQQKKKKTIQLSKSTLELNLWQQALLHAARTKPDFSQAALIKHLFDLNGVSIQAIIKLPAKYFGENKITAAVLSNWKKELKEKGSEPPLGRPIKKGRKKKEQEQDEPAEIGDLIDSRLGSSDPNQSGDHRPQLNDTELSSRIDADTADGIFLQHAGLILLHPFLPALFKNLKWTDGKVFRDLTCHQKALYLLHYLATGVATAAEHELVMEKIVCAYPLHKPVDSSIELSPEETNEADQLLAEVVAQWEILKNTSPDGLREGFLQRNGKLYAEADILYLQVETNSIDVLLDHLPWNIGIVRLPWIKELLKVEWR